MSLVKTVTALIERRGPSDAEMLLPDCHGHTRAQVVRALQNAAHQRLIHRVSFAKPSEGKHNRLGVYALGAAEEASLRVSRPRVASVWQLGAMQ